MKYEDIEAVNFSTLKAMAVSPLAYHYATQMPRQDTPAMLLGRAVHCAVLEPEAFDDRFLVYPGRRAGKDWKEFKAKYPGAEIIKPEQRILALNIRDAVRSNPEAMKYLTGGVAEASLEWDAGNGIRAKGRVDYIQPGTLVELKTTRTIDARRFYADAARKFYHVQMPWYQWGATDSGFDVSNVVMIRVQNEAPFDVIVDKVPLAVLAEGETVYMQWLDRLAECLESDTWPGIQPEEGEYQLPAWAKAEEDTTLIIGGQEYAL